MSGPEQVDLLITGGSLLDGTGGPARPGSVASVDGRLHLDEADWRPAHAGRTVDARGMVVAPGFIDLHSHGGLVILADPRHEPKVRQGVTTELIGVDGNGYAPFAQTTSAPLSSSTPASTDAHRSPTTGTASPATSAATTGDRR